MKYKNRKIPALLFAFVLSISPSLFSCSEKNSDETENATATNSDSSGTAEETEIANERESIDYLPIIDYGAFEFKVLSYAELNNPVHTNNDVAVESDNGETLNDAVYRRNMEIEEKYNIKIIDHHSENYQSDLNKTVASNDDTYSLATARMISALPNMVGGYFYDLYKTPHINLKQPWYLQSAIEQLTLNNGLYVVPSEMLISPYGATSLILFNKQLQKDMGLPNPYKMVIEGSWTFDSLREMSREATRDLDGDGSMTKADQWGFVVFQDIMSAMLVAGGGEYGIKTGSETFEITFNNEKNANIMDRAFLLIYDEYVTMNLQKTVFADYHPGTASVKMMGVLTDARSLFYWVRMGNVRLARTIDVEYGMLPMPKFDEMQKNYRNWVSPHQMQSLAIPVTTPDLERSAIIMEALSAESRYTVIPAFFEIALKMKWARDDESAEMIPYIFDNTVIDPIATYNFGNIVDDFHTMSNTNNTNIQSFYESRISLIERDIKAMSDALGK